MLTCISIDGRVWRSALQLHQAILVPTAGNQPGPLLPLSPLHRQKVGAENGFKAAARVQGRLDSSKVWL